MIINVGDFDYSIIRKLPVISKKHPGKRGKHEKTYIASINAFDIETSRIKEIEQSIMYIWQAQIGLEYTIIGRTWYEFKYFMERISKIIGSSIMVWHVHNLSYEFCFLKGIYNFDSSEVFRTDSRKVLKCSMYGNIEFRCSYLLTNLSLDRFTRQMGVENQKLEGKKFNYNKVRYPDTELTEYEINYCINDVKGLVQALTKLFELDGDNVRTVPLTATGYVRRDLKQAMRKYNFNQLHEMLPNIHIQEILFERFRGGDTHRNRWLANVVLKNVKSMDRVSSYPDIMLNCPVPMTKFYPLPESSLDTVKFMLNSKKYALLMRIGFWDIELKDMFNGAVYLSRDKCRNIINGEWDNGRIIKRSFLETSITDIDLRLILKYYKFSRSNPYEVYYRKYRKLPKMLTDVVMKYYKVKTELKGVSEDDPQYIYYCNRKARLNARYGCLVQSPCKQSIIYKGGEFIEDTKPAAELLEQSNKKAFLNYRWGVW